MCGRFDRHTPIPKLVKRFKVKLLSPEAPKESYNIAPTQQIVIVNNEGQKQLIPARWGLVPSWAKDTSIGNRIINARSETITEKSAFRHALKKQRCLIPADGFFEWKKEGNRKLPVYIRLSSKKPFAFAGLYNLWTSPEGETMYTCTIITAAANDLVKPFHERMPVILQKSEEDIWLNSSIGDEETLLPLLTAFDADKMEAYEVTPKMNRPEWDRPENIEPV